MAVRAHLAESFVLGIDVGFRAMGYAVQRLQDKALVYTDSIRTQPSSKKQKLRKADDDIQCTQVLTRELKEVFEHYKPQAVFLEMPSAGAKGARANRTMGIATGVIVTLLEVLDIPPEYFLPHDVKKAVCGKKNASKDEVEQAVRLRWPHHQGWPDVKAIREHASDAAATLLTAERLSSLYRICLNHARD